jgi:hypothetical protein
MSDTKISAMPAAATLDGTEITPIVQTGVNKQVTTANYVAQVLNVNRVLVSQGGTGAVSLTGYVYGNGTSAMTASTTIPFSAITGTVPTTQGGTGIITYTTGDILYASATNTLAKLAGNTTATNKFLRQTGTGTVSAAPNWDIISPSDINTQYGAFHFDNGSTLTAQLQNNNVTSMSVADTSQFASSGDVLIGDEVIAYTGKTLTTLTGLTRGVAGTSAATHANGSAVTSAQVAVANTATPVRLNITDFTNGVTVASETDITFAIGGIYNIQFSCQLLNASNANDNAAFWFEQNGSNIVESCSIATTIKKDGSIVGAAIVAANIYVSASAGDVVKMYWSTTTGNSILVTYPQSLSAPVRPASPAVILTVNQVS